MAIFLTVLPFLLRLANKIMDAAGMSAEEKKETTALIIASKDDATTPVAIKDGFKDLRARLKARKEAEAKESARKAAEAELSPPNAP